MISGYFQAGNNGQLLQGRDTGFTLHILRAESPGPEVTKLVPHMRDSSILLYGIYIVLTVLDFLFLVAGGMPESVDRDF